MGITSSIDCSKKEGQAKGKKRAILKPDWSEQPYLFLDKCQVITKTNKLMSGDINKAQSMVKNHHPEIGGLFCCTIGGSLEFPQAQGDKWMQIVNDGDDHWVLIAKGFSQPEHVLVYDSLPGSPWYSNHIMSCMSFWNLQIRKWHTS